MRTRHRLVGSMLIVAALVTGCGDGEYSDGDPAELSGGYASQG